MGHFQMYFVYGAQIAMVMYVEASQFFSSFRMPIRSRSTMFPRVNEAMMEAS
jgi:hypothetical protein